MANGFVATLTLFMVTSVVADNVVTPETAPEFETVILSFTCKTELSDVLTECPDNSTEPPVKVVAVKLFSPDISDSNPIVKVSVGDTTTVVSFDTPTTFKVSPPDIACVVEDESLKVKELVAAKASFIAATIDEVSEPFKLLKSPTSEAKLLNVVLNVFIVSVVATDLKAIIF